MTGSTRRLTRALPGEEAILNSVPMFRVFVNTSLVPKFVVGGLCFCRRILMPQWEALPHLARDEKPHSAWHLRISRTSIATKACLELETFHQMEACSTFRRCAPPSPATQTCCWETWTLETDLALVAACRLRSAAVENCVHLTATVVASVATSCDSYIRNCLQLKPSCRYPRCFSSQLKHLPALGTECHPLNLFLYRFNAQLSLERGFQDSISCLWNITLEQRCFAASAGRRSNCSDEAEVHTEQAITDAAQGNDAAAPMVVAATSNGSIHLSKVALLGYTLEVFPAASSENRLVSLCEDVEAVSACLRLRGLPPVTATPAHAAPPCTGNVPQMGLQGARRICGE